MSFDIAHILRGSNGIAFLVLALFFVVELEEIVRYIIRRVKEAKCRRDAKCDDKEPPRLHL